MFLGQRVSCLEVEAMLNFNGNGLFIYYFLYSLVAGTCNTAVFEQLQ